MAETNFADLLIGVLSPTQGHPHQFLHDGVLLEYRVLSDCHNKIFELFLIGEGHVLAMAGLR